MMRPTSPNKARQLLLEEVAMELCQCDLTDGFCDARRNPDCRCWRLARIALKGVEKHLTGAAYVPAFPYDEENSPP